MLAFDNILRVDVHLSRAPFPPTKFKLKWALQVNLTLDHATLGKQEFTLAYTQTREWSHGTAFRSDI